MAGRQISRTNPILLMPWPPSSPCRIRRRTSALSRTWRRKMGKRTQFVGERPASAAPGGPRNEAIFGDPGFQPVHFGEYRGQLLLQVFLGVLIILVGEFADPVFKLEVAQVLIDSGFPLIEVIEWRYRLRLGQILCPNAEERRNNGERDNAGDGDDQMIPATPILRDPCRSDLC